MSFLFDKKTKSAMKWIWIFASIIIILSMTLVFSGGQGAFGGGGGNRSQSAPPSQQQPPKTEILDTQAEDPAVSSKEPVPFEINVPGIGG